MPKRSTNRTNKKKKPTLEPARAPRSRTRTALETREIDQRVLTTESRAGLKALKFSPSSIEQSLLLDNDRDAIDQLIGKEYAEKLRGLAREANQAQSRGGQSVLILPGILGSTLAIGDDTIWFDLIDIMRGKLVKLALGSGANNVASNGVFWPTYIELFLKLKIAGFRPEYFHFDWRKPISDAGKLLVGRIKQLAATGQPVSLVAHSMGGLVARSAIKLLGAQAESQIGKTVLLGTPNSGSYAPALVLANDYSTVSWMERLDFANQNGTLVKDVFSTFVGLIEMIPEAANNDGRSLFEPNAYPTKASSARTAVLQAAAGLQSRIAPGSSKIWMIAGVGIETVVGLNKKPGDEQRFVQTISTDGDGTVPLRLAKLPNANHRYCRSGHSSLPQNNEVILATIDILESGTTDRLFDKPTDATRTIAVPSREFVSNRDLNDLTKASSVNEQDVASFLSPLLSMTGTGTATAAQPTPVDESLGTPISEKPIIVGRKFQQRLDLRLVLGDISTVRGRALMLGVFKDVRPGGAAASVDAKIGGLLAEVIDRRMFAANVGEVFVLPTTRQGIGAEMVVLIGLGSFSQFSAKSLRTSVENATRTLLRCNVDDLVTVPMGGGAGLTIPAISETIVDGVQAAMRDSKDRLSLRGLTIATNSEADYGQLSSSMLSLAASSRFDGMEFTLERQVLPAADRGLREVSLRGLATKTSSSYIIVRSIPDPLSDKNNVHNVDVSMLGTATKATVLSGEIQVSEATLTNLLDRIGTAKNDGTIFAKASILGNELADLLLPTVVKEALKQSKPSSISLINDYWGSKIPWEVLSIDSWHAGLEGNLSRKYSTPNLSVAKWLHERRSAPDFNMLLIADPTEDLPGAAKESERIRNMVRKHNKIRLTEISANDATKVRLAKEFSSGNYDIVHYAGHAYFDPNNRSQSGILCSGNQVLSGRDLASLENLPTLVVFNACEAARVRAAVVPTRINLSAKRGQTSNRKQEKVMVTDVVDRNVSFAEAFLRGGVGGFIGTYWPVGDDAASTFAEVFYSGLLDSKSIGEALRDARAKLYQDKEPDFLNYIHYGDAEFRVKT